MWLKSVKLLIFLNLKKNENSHVIVCRYKFYLILRSLKIILVRPVTNKKF